MRNSYIHLFCSIFILIFVGSCSKTEDQLFLDQDYHHVADVLEYCQGACDEQLVWENSAVLISGYIPDITNDSIFEDYIEQERFYLSDIRNGMFMEVRIENDLEAIAETLSAIQKLDKVYLKGVTLSIIVNEGNECAKGVFISLSNATDIQLNL